MSTAAATAELLEVEELELVVLLALVESLLETWLDAALVELAPSVL